jgi:hypothetical protein
VPVTGTVTEKLKAEHITGFPQVKIILGGVLLPLWSVFFPAWGGGPGSHGGAGAVGVSYRRDGMAVWPQRASDVHDCDSGRWKSPVTQMHFKTEVRVGSCIVVTGRNASSFLSFPPCRSAFPLHNRVQCRCNQKQWLQVRIKRYRWWWHLLCMVVGGCSAKVTSQRRGA